MLKRKVVVDKAIYIAQAVLHYSKLEMYRLFYVTINIPGLLIADVILPAGRTDSFIMEIRVKKTEAEVDNPIVLSFLVKVYHSWRVLLYSSNYSPEHPLFPE